MATWRLGLDVGTNSIGWAAIGLFQIKNTWMPVKIISSGVRIFSDGRNPKNKQSLAVQRRLPRQQRKTRDRYLKRRQEFMDKLTKHKLMPDNYESRKKLEKTDPWALRVKGLDEKLTLHELGRALFHLDQRRGFKSNRKTDKSEGDESGKIKSAAEKVVFEMKQRGARTLGEYLASPRVADPKAAHDHRVRARLHGAGAKAYYDFYPTRALIEQEFITLWQTQAQTRFHGPQLSEQAREDLLNTLLFQRDLKAQPVGKCSIDPTQRRAHKALPSVQRLRIYQEINHLSVRLPGEPERKLNKDDRDLLVKKALTTGKVTFDSMRKALKLPQSARFNLESEKRKHLDGEKTAAALAARARWGKQWRDIPIVDQEKIVHRLLDEEDGEALINWLTSAYGLTRDVAEAVGDVKLPTGHGRLSEAVGHNVLDELIKDVITYDEAVIAAGYNSHFDLDSDDEVHDRLPYYGKVMERHVAFGSGEPLDSDEIRYGKIANPTVHVALNQIRHVVNDLIKRFGPPTEIVVELARDLPLSAKQKFDLEKMQRENQEVNETRRKTLGRLGEADSSDNRFRLRLWEELNPTNPLGRRCPYTGEQIGIGRVFSPDVEIDHILPRSRTLDDSPANQTLSMRWANRLKTSQSPFEAFGHSPEGIDWQEIVQRSSTLPHNKSWRFSADAMVRFENEERNFLDRQLVDTQYMSRLAHTYLKRTGADVWVTPGRLTADLRWAWGLNSVLADHNQSEQASPGKNRFDHRHHAIDAVVIALTDRGLLKRVATMAGQAELRFDRRHLSGIAEPWKNFRETVRQSVHEIVVSHKKDHGLQGALHEDTAYGIVKDPISGESRLVSRKPLIKVSRKEVGKIGDLKIRGDIEALINGLSDSEMKTALIQYSSETGVKRVRIHKKEDHYKTIVHGDDYLKAVIPGENYCVDVVKTADGRWHGLGLSVFDANQKNPGEHWKVQFPDALHVMRLHKNDQIKLVCDGTEKIMRIIRLVPSDHRVFLAGHCDGGVLQKRHEDADDFFRWDWPTFDALKARRARLVHVTSSGRVFDPGPIS